MRLALGLLMVSGCLLLAALVHFNWQSSADQNAAELVEQINHRTTTSVARNLGALCVSIDLARLAKFLDRLEITRYGKAFILAPDGRLLSADGWKPLSQAPSAATRAIAAGLNAEAIDLSTMTTACSMMGRDVETGGQFYLYVSRLTYRDRSVVIGSERRRYSRRWTESAVTIAHRAS